MVQTKPIIVVVGGQYGSEAKGLITDKLCRDRKVDVAIRTGTVNAGHTVYHNGKPYAMQQLPVAAFDPNVTLVLGPGAYIHPEILAREVGWVTEAGIDIANRLFIDIKCGIHTEHHTELAAAAGRHHSMGATGKGCSEAVVHKIKSRGGVPALFSEWLDENPDNPIWGMFGFADTVAYVNAAYDRGEQLLIEGTQGTFLDLHLGPYPYTTHKQTQAANWMAEAGLSCTLPVDLVSVMRTYPIRVAGNSGPLPRECSWLQLAGWINQKRRSKGLDNWVDPLVLRVWDTAVTVRTGTMGDPAHWNQATREQHQRLASEVHKDAWTSLAPEHQVELRKLFEMTTVTKKLRRIAQWSDEDAARSIMLNRPTSVALTFLNYDFPEAWGVTRKTFGDLPQRTRESIYAYVGIKQDILGVPISYVSFGPSVDSTFRLYEDEVPR